jgi:hypothetical protein
MSEPCATATNKEGLSVLKEYEKNNSIYQTWLY